MQTGDAGDAAGVAAEPAALGLARDDAAAATLATSGCIDAVLEHQVVRFRKARESAAISSISRVSSRSELKLSSLTQ